MKKAKARPPGRPPNDARLLPGDRHRVRAWTRVVKRIAAPELSMDRAHQGPVTTRLSERYQIDISATQWKTWWDDGARPQAKTVSQFERNEPLSKLSSWLDQTVRGVPLQRHLCAFDALIRARSYDEVERENALALAREVIGQVELIWAPRLIIGKYSYVLNVPNLPYLYEGDGLYPDVTVDPDLRIALKKMPKDLIFGDGLHDPFNQNSIATFLLVQGLNGFEMEKMYRHWVVDFVSTVFALNVIATMFYVTPPVAEPTDLGKISYLIEPYLAQWPDIGTLKHNLIRWPFSFAVDSDKLESVIIAAATDYKKQLAEVGIDVAELYGKWSESIWKGYRGKPGKLQNLHPMIKT